MIKLHKIKNFFHKDEPQQGNGLSADLSELMGMRRYIPIIRNTKAKAASSVDSGNIKSAFRGRGIEMEEIRQYQFGDDIRDIDWRVTARMNEPYTKIYAQERNREIYVWLDLSPIMLFGSKTELKSVTAAKIAALLGWIALDNKDRFGCVVFDGQQSWLFKPRNDRAYIAAICKKIAEISQNALNNSHNDMDAKLKSLKMLSRQVKKDGSVFVISSMMYWEEVYDNDLAYLAKNNRLFLFDIYDELERKAPRSGQYMAQFGEDRLTIDSSNKEYNKTYRDYFAKKYQERQDWCKHFGCQLIDFSQNSNVIKNLKIF